MGFVLSTNGLYLNVDRVPLYHILVFIFTPKKGRGVDNIKVEKCVRACVRTCAYERFVLVGEAQQQEQRLRHSAATNEHAVTPR